MTPELVVTQDPPAKTKKQLAAEAAAAVAEPEKKPVVDDKGAKPPVEDDETPKGPSAAQKLLEKRKAALDEREKELEAREKAAAAPKEGPDSKPKAEPKPFVYQKPDWEKLGYKREESGELTDALDSAYEQIGKLTERLDELEGKHEEDSRYAKELSQARHSKVQDMIASGLEKAAAELNDDYELDLDEAEVANAFVKAVKGGLVSFNPLVDDPTPEMMMKSWKLLNADVIDGVTPKKKGAAAEEDKGTPPKRDLPQSKGSSAERKSGMEGLSGKDRVKAILADANPNTPISS